MINPQEKQLPLSPCCNAPMMASFKDNIRVCVCSNCGQVVYEDNKIDLYYFHMTTRMVPPYNNLPLEVKERVDLVPGGYDACLRKFAKGLKKIYPLAQKYILEDILGDLIIKSDNT